MLTSSGVRLLFDQNLSPRLVRRLTDVFPGSLHVTTVGLDRAPDLVVWEYARQHGLMLATKDVDFADLAAIRGFPPRVVWLRLRNCTTAEVESTLRQQASAILQVSTDPLVGVLIVA